MRTTYGLLPAILLPLLGAAGCGSGEQPVSETRPELNKPAEEILGKYIKEQIYTTRTSIRERGLGGTEMTMLSRSLEDYENQPIGDHLETYRQIDTKLTELRNLRSSPSPKQEAERIADEMAALADKLPGEANPVMLGDWKKAP